MLYRKSTYSEAIIPNDLYHTMNYKMGNIYSVCERVLKCVDRKILKIELSRIKEIISSLVDKTVKRVNNKKILEDK